MSTATRPPATQPAQRRSGQRAAVTPDQRGRFQSNLTVYSTDKQGRFVNRNVVRLTPAQQQQRAAAEEKKKQDNEVRHVRSDAFKKMQNRRRLSTATLECKPVVVGGRVQVGRNNWLCRLDQ